MKALILVVLLVITCVSAAERKYPTGEVKLKYDLVDGMFHGAYQEFYKNGQVKVDGQYENDKKVGVWTFYFDNGQIETTQDFSTVAAVVSSGTKCAKPQSFQTMNGGLHFYYKGKKRYRNNTNLKKIIRKSDSKEAKRHLKKARRSVALTWTLPWTIVALPATPFIAMKIWDHRNASIDAYNEHVYKTSEEGCSDEYIKNHAE